MDQVQSRTLKEEYQHLWQMVLPTGDSKDSGSMELPAAGGYGDMLQLSSGPEIGRRDPPVPLSLDIQRHNLTLGFRNGCRGRRR
jgi:hypothetical protein